MSKIDSILKIDSVLFNFDNIKFNSVTNVELTINLGNLTMDNQTTLTFNDLLKLPISQPDNLYILTRLRLMICPEGELTLINIFDGQIDESYLNRMKILLNKAGFIDIRIINIPFPLTITAERRPVIEENLGYKLTLKEAITPEEILACHMYAKEYYYFKDFNYDLDVVKLFDLNCDHFAVYDENNDIYCMARIVIRTPGHNCPFMHATIDRDTGNSHFIIPGIDKRIGEIMAIFSAGKKGIISFKVLMEYISQYSYSIAHFDSIWTTYDVEDQYTGTYYKNKFMMKDTDIKLKYSDFGGIWNLVYTDKIVEMKNLHHQIFKKNKE